MMLKFKDTDTDTACKPDSKPTLATYRTERHGKACQTGHNADISILALKHFDLNYSIDLSIAFNRYASKPTVLTQSRHD